MKILYKRLPSLRKHYSFSATLGIFDGVHRGHAWIIRKVLARAGSIPSCKPLVVTFFPAPEYLLKHAAQFHLNEISEKVRALRQAGCPNTIVFKFDKKLASFSGAAFFKALMKKIPIKYLFVGEDFKFGKNRRHGMDALRMLLEQHSARLIMMKKKKINGITVSSSRIRRLLREGDVETARRLLGRPYAIEGPVISGKGIGRLIGVPTANISVSRYKLIPRPGVYAVEAVVGHKNYYGACNILDASALSALQKNATPIEVFIFHFHKSLRGKRAEVRFIKRIRDEQRFSSMHALHERIEKDIAQCKKIFRVS